MAGEPKWVQGVTGQTPLDEVARLSFAARLQAVEYAWTLVLEGHGDPSHVHHLRVSTRRAVAPLRVFGDLMTRRSNQRLDRLLHKLRRAAGNARDEDVFAERLRNRLDLCDDNELAGLDWLAGGSAKRAASAYKAVAQTDRMRAKWQRLIDQASPNAGKCKETLADRASSQIAKRLASFQSAALARIEKPDRLHRLRIVAKRLRYSLELLGPAIDGADHAIHALRSAQDILGAAHDARTIADRLGEQLSLLESCREIDRQRYQPGIVAWKTELEAEADSGPIQFRMWQREWNVLLAATGLSLLAKDSKPAAK